MIGLIAIILFFVSIPVAFYLEYKSDLKEWGKRESDDNAWLAQEMTKPRYFIEFELVSGEVKKTSKHQPWQTCAGSDYNFQRTSESSAKASLERDYERGYFTDENGVTYPACNVKSAVVKVES